MGPRLAFCTHLTSLPLVFPTASSHRPGQILRNSRACFIQAVRRSGIWPSGMQMMSAAHNEFLHSTLSHRRSKLGIPTATVVFGSSTAGGAYTPGMSDYVLMVKVGRIQTSDKRSQSLAGHFFRIKRKCFLAVRRSSRWQRERSRTPRGRCALAGRERVLMHYFSLPLRSLGGADMHSRKSGRLECCGRINYIFIINRRIMPCGTLLVR